MLLFVEILRFDVIPLDAQVGLVLAAPNPRGREILGKIRLTCLILYKMLLHDVGRGKSMQ